MVLVVAGACLLLAAQSAPLTMTAADFQPLVGSWQGTLTYTDYSDDKRQVTLPTTIVITRAKRPGVRLAYTYVEPDGSREENITEMLAAKTPGRLAFDGEWLIVEKAVTPSTLSLIVEGEGRDNNRRALMRESIRVTADSLIHTKLVRYDGTANFFQRNRYALARLP